MPMKVESSERSTGNGAERFTAVLHSGKWVRVSEYPGHRYLGRQAGVHEYSVEVPDGTVTADFYRSNSGKEAVTASNGIEWGSFEEAARWGKDIAGMAKVS